jgi:SAM-dependent methyltransferase
MDITSDIEKAAPFLLENFDHVISTCILHHLIDLETGLSNMVKLMAPHGKITIYMPLDGGIIHKVGRTLTSQRQAKRLGISGQEFKRIMELEHVRKFPSIRAALKQVAGEFDLKMKEHWYPLKMKSLHLNAFYIVELRKNI